MNLLQKLKDVFKPNKPILPDGYIIHVENNMTHEVEWKYNPVTKNYTFTATVDGFIVPPRKPVENNYTVFVSPNQYQHAFMEAG